MALLFIGMCVRGNFWPRTLFITSTPRHSHSTALSYELYKEGFHNIVNIDYSAVCIRSMKHKYGYLDGMTWLCLDAVHLDLEAESFDLVIDKVCLHVL